MFVLKKGYSEINRKVPFFGTTRMYKWLLTLCLLFLTHYWNHLQAQPDFKLVDSLINKNLFPIHYPTQNRQSLNSLDSNKFTEAYTFYSDEELNKKRVRYFLRKKDMLYPSSVSTRKKDDNLSGDIVVFVPTVHLVFFYVHTFGRKTESYKYINFFVDHFVKNNGDTSWTTRDYVVNLKIIDDEEKLVKNFTFDQKNHPSQDNSEGWISTGFNGLNIEHKIDLWNHFDPNLYQYTIEVLGDEGAPNEYVREKTGFRDIRMEGKDIYLNNKKLFLKTAIVDPKAFTSSNSVIDYLKILKVNNFNSIILTAKGEEELFDLCDSIGLYVIQEMNHAVFNSLPGLLEYFVTIKHHPSFIAWSDTGLKLNWLKILKRLDQDRPIFRDKSFTSVTIDNWKELGSSEREKVKNVFQTFSFYFIPTTSILKIDIEEYFRYADKIALKWAIKQKDSIVTQGTIKNLLVKNDKVEVKIPVEMNHYASPGNSFEFEIVVTEDCYPYKAGDTIATSRFRYISQDGKLIYKVDYQ